jgi:hypothetical protein
MTAEEFYDAARAAVPGSVILYHVGVTLGEAPERFTGATHAARHLWNEGLVTLVQRRLASQGQQRFQYLAIWRRYPRKPSASPVIRIVARNGDAVRRKMFNETRFWVPAEIARAWTMTKAA